MKHVLDPKLVEKQKNLERILRDTGGLLVAFSGGVDSTFLLAVARSVLADRVLAVTAESPSVPQRELDAARELAKRIGARHLVLATREMDNPDYAANPANRCYFCKSELYTRLQAVAAEQGYTYIANGINLDDLGDHRPGLTAAAEHAILSPLREAQLTKADIRALSHHLGLPTWDKPAMACLASRIPYGDAVTENKLSMIEQAEDFLLTLGFRQVRVRHHGEQARIELGREEIARLFNEELSDKVNARLREIGFRFVTVDIAGYRTGSLNEGLPRS